MAPSPPADGGAASSAEKPPDGAAADASGLAERLNMFASIIMPPAAGGRAAGDAAVGVAADKKPKPEPIGAAGVGTSAAAGGGAAAAEGGAESGAVWAQMTSALCRNLAIGSSS